MPTYGRTAPSSAALKGNAPCLPVIVGALEDGTKELPLHYCPPGAAAPSASDGLRTDTAVKAAASAREALRAKAQK